MSYRDGQLWTNKLDRCRELRRGSTDAERLLWRALRARQLGAKFRRQHEFGPYILDFVCTERRLAVEVDGAQHLEPEALRRDEVRTVFLVSHGLRVVRFTDREVLLELPAVVEMIRQALEQPSP